MLIFLIWNYFYKFRFPHLKLSFRKISRSEKSDLSARCPQMKPKNKKKKQFKFTEIHLSYMKMKILRHSAGTTTRLNRK